MTAFRVIIALAAVSLFFFLSNSGRSFSGAGIDFKTEGQNAPKSKPEQCAPCPDSPACEICEKCETKECPKVECPKQECPKCAAAPPCPPPTPCPAPRLSSPAEEKPDLVITSEAHHFDRSSISAFLWSLRDARSPAHVLLFTTDPDDAELKLLAEEFAPVTLAPWQVKEGEDLVIVRFGFYNAWLETNKAAGRYNRIFVSDLDVVFFKDPFRIAIPDNGLALFAENRTLTIGMCEAHRNWMAECDGRLGDLWKLMARESRICAGTILGTASAVVDLLKQMADLLKTKRCNDQLTLQYLHFSRSVAPATVYPTETGPGATLGTQLFWALDRWGRVLNLKGDVVSFAHQFRYHEAIYEVVQRRWPYLPRGDVREEAAVPIPRLRLTNGSSEHAGKDLGKSGGSVVWRTCSWVKVRDCMGGVPNQEASHDPNAAVVVDWKQQNISYPAPKVPEWEGTGFDPTWQKGWDWSKRTGNATRDKLVALKVAGSAVKAPIWTINNGDPFPTPNQQRLDSPDRGGGPKHDDDDELDEDVVGTPEGDALDEGEEDDEEAPGLTAADPKLRAAEPHIR